MNNEEKIRLVLETLGVDNVRQATKAIKEMAASVDSLEGEMDQLARSISEGVEKPMERFLVTLKNGRKVWNDSAEGLEYLGKKVGRKSDFGQRVLETSYIVDDIQYGFRGIVNNIPQLARTFGISTAAVGAFGIAAVGVNQAIAMLGPLFEDTNEPAKKFGEIIGDFAKGAGSQKVEIENLTKEIKKLSDSFKPGMFESIEQTVKRMDDLIEKQREVNQLAEESQKLQADIKAGNKAIEEKGLDKERSGLFGEFFGSLTQDQASAMQDKLMPDQMQRAEGMLIDEEMAKLDSSGGFKTQWQREFAKLEVTKRIRGNTGAIEAKARDLASGQISAAQRGDARALNQIGGAVPEFADFLAYDEADTAFQSGLQQRSAAGARRRDRLAKEDAAMKRFMGRKLGGKAGSEIAIQQGMAAAGPSGPAPAALEPGSGEAMAPGQGLLPTMTLEEFQANQSRNAEIRNQVLSQFDPAQMAAMRQMEAGQGPFAGRNLKMLESRDMAIFSNALTQQGMSPADAEAATLESLRGGKSQLGEFAGTASDLMKRNVSVTEAAVMMMQKAQQDFADLQMRLQMAEQQLTIMNNGNRAPARNQNGHANR